MARSKLGPLRNVREWITTPSTKLEPITVLLECGHVAHGCRQDAKRARCPACKKAVRLRQAGARIRTALKQRRLEPGVECIYVSVEKVRETVKERERPEGLRVLRVQVWDETPGRGKATPKRKQVCEALRIACNGAGVEYVRAKLLEMAEELDGVVLVT